MCAAPASAWACSHGGGSLGSWNAVSSSAPRKQRPHRNRCLPLPFLSLQPHAARASPCQRHGTLVAAHASASSPPPSWLDPQGAEQHVRELLQPPRCGPAQRLTSVAATSPVAHPEAPEQGAEHSALDGSSTVSSDASSSSSSSSSSWGDDGAQAQWLVLDSLGGPRARVGMSDPSQMQGSEVQPVHHAVLHPPPELPEVHGHEVQEGSERGAEGGSTGTHSGQGSGGDTVGSGVPLVQLQHDGEQERGLGGMEHREAAAVSDPNQHPIETLVGRYVQGEEGRAAAQLEQQPAGSKAGRLAGVAAADAQQEGAVRGWKSVQEKGSKRARKKSSGKQREEQPETMRNVLAKLGLPPEVAEGLLSAVQQGKVAKYITPARLDKLVRRVLEAGEDLGVSTATLHTVLRRQPRVLIRLPLPLLKQRAAALRDLLGCCDEEQEQGEREEGVQDKREDSSSNSSNGSSSSSGSVQGAGSSSALPAEASTEGAGGLSSSSSGGGSGSRSSRRRAYPPVSLSHVLSVVPCLWCYKIDTTKHKLHTLSSLLQLSEPEAQALARRCPTLLSCAPTSLVAKAEALRQLTGLQQSEVSAMIVAVPQLLFLSQNAVATKFRDLATLLGVDQQEVAAMVASRPLLLTSSTDTLRANWEELCRVASRSVRWQHELHTHLAPSTRASMLLASKVKTRRLHFLLSIGAHRHTPLNSTLAATHEQFCLRFPNYKRWSPSQGVASSSLPSFSSAKTASRVASLKQRVSAGSRARSASSQPQK